MLLQDKLIHNIICGLSEYTDEMVDYITGIYFSIITSK